MEMKKGGGVSFPGVIGSLRVPHMVGKSGACWWEVKFTLVH